MDDQRYSIEQYPKGDSDLIGFVKKAYDRARESRDNAGITEEMIIHRDFMRNTKTTDYVNLGQKDLNEQKVTDISGDFRGSKAAQKLSQRTAIMSDQRPKLYVKVLDAKPKKEIMADSQAIDLQQEIELAGGLPGLDQMFVRLIDFWWMQNEVDLAVINFLSDGDSIGTTYPKVYWDKNIDDVVLDRIAAEFCFPEAGYANFRACPCFFYVRLLDKRSVGKLYGKDAVEKAESQAIVREIISDNKNGRDEYDDVVVIESFWMDDSTDKKGVRKYPHGRWIVFGTQIILDEAIETPFWPMEKYTPNVIAGEWHGEPLLRVMLPADRLYNKVAQMVADNLFVSGNSCLITREGSLKNEAELSNMVGQIIKMQKGANLSDIAHFTAGRIIAQDAYQLLSICDQIITEKSGVFAAAEGRKEAAMSGRAVIALQEGTNRFLRTPAKIFERVLEKCMNKVVYHMIESYKKGRPYEYTTEEGTTLCELPFDLNQIDWKLSISISPGSSLPKDPETEANIVNMLADRYPNLVPPDLVAQKMGDDDVARAIRQAGGPGQQVTPDKIQMVVKLLKENPNDMNAVIAKGEAAGITADDIKQIATQMTNSIGQAGGGSGMQTMQPGAPANTMTAEQQATPAAAIM